MRQERNETNRMFTKSASGVGLEVLDLTAPAEPGAHLNPFFHQRPTQATKEKVVDDPAWELSEADCLPVSVPDNTFKQHKPQ